MRLINKTIHTHNDKLAVPSCTRLLFDVDNPSTINEIIKCRQNESIITCVGGYHSSYPSSQASEATSLGTGLAERDGTGLAEVEGDTGLA